VFYTSGVNKKIFTIIISIVIILSFEGWLIWQNQQLIIQSTYTPQDTNQPHAVVWKAYQEDTIMHFALRYPESSLSQPIYGVSRESESVYAVRFGEHFQVSSLASRYSNINEYLEIASTSPDTLFVRKTTIDGYEAAVMRDSQTDNQTQEHSFSVTFIAEGRQYWIFFRNPVYSDTILESFTVLKKP
jgi:hypothetical protein